MRTSNFTLAGRHPRAVSIAWKAPADFTGPTYRPLVPPYWLVKCFKDGRLGEGEYGLVYDRDVLCRLAVAPAVYDELRNLADGEPILLCYERAGVFCHRRLAAAWLGVRLEEGIPEIRRLTAADEALIADVEKG